eukprot:4663241-Lingulodinium_polyedra.AAC.1
MQYSAGKLFAAGEPCSPSELSTVGPANSAPPVTMCLPGWAGTANVEHEGRERLLAGRRASVQEGAASIVEL